MLKTLAHIVSLGSLGVLVIVPGLFLVGTLSSPEKMKMIMLIATIIWFVSRPLYMWKETEK